ncbi:DUF2516 family protein [Mycolicibacillus trivialis]|uniref:DUF2516 domain-containing protein n=1 Tax=Mycolicibacillus trivialis TaxID=1798 RepID=A0A1X2EN34_9MYCO|nr:DUF2516 family protein [Mycolicibacillus trivialis]ORX07023.1 hypothetical protein AWC30_05540 [Mycolicibacillus trivialis]
MTFPYAANLVLLAVQAAVALATLYALVHAALQRPDAYAATEKLTKPVWLVILAVGLLLAVLPNFILGPVIAACAAGVYLVDVRPRLLDVQGKSR